MPDARDRIVISDVAQLFDVSTRRKFLKALGAGGSIVLLPSVFAACDDDDIIIDPPFEGVTLDLSDDTGILNYAFALEQLEAAFYTAVIGSAPFASFTDEEKEVFTDLRNHEVIHREFFRAVLGGNAIPDLAVEQSEVATALASHDSILLTSETFEDLGVSAYNGAGKYLTSATNLLVAGKIVSVEARHAAAIRDLRDTDGEKFANSEVVNPMGLDVKLEPSLVLAAADPFIETEIAIDPGPTGTATANQAPTHSS
ncbi:MAG: ferritin-like domain-containing protein [Gemmatimonadaceae bacterium]